MEQVFAVLPCNGMDKSAGCVAREIALQFVEKGCHLICPVLCGASSARYSKIAEAYPLLVIDGCTMRCASKLAAKKGLKAVKRINVADFAQAEDFSLNPSLRLGETELDFARKIVRSFEKND